MARVTIKSLQKEIAQLSESRDYYNSLVGEHRTEISDLKSEKEHLAESNNNLRIDFKKARTKLNKLKSAVEGAYFSKHSEESKEEVIEHRDLMHHHERNKYTPGSMKSVSYPMRLPKKDDNSQFMYWIHIQLRGEL